MPSLEGLLSIARTAIVSQRAAMNVAGHNVANAETAGYTRQRVQLTATTPETNALGTFGTGVAITTVLRQREALLDQQVRQQSAPASGFAARSALLRTIEGVFGEPSPNGLANALDAFWNAWSDLASEPASSTAKIVVRQNGAAVAATFNRYANQLADLDTTTRAGIAGMIDTVNRLASQIAAINAEILPAEASGGRANDLRDARDRLIDQLSELVPVTVIDRTNGSNQVMLGGMPLVDGSGAKSLALGSGVPLTVSLTGDRDILRTLGGALGATLDALNSDLATARADLDALASALISDVNALHATGWSPPSGSAGNWNPATPPTGSGILFFDDAPVYATARTIRLSAPVAADASAIAAGSTRDAPGDNSLALALAALRDAAPSAPSGSFGAGYRSLVANVASQTAAATDSAEVFGTLAQQAAERRQAASGVSIDEELVSLMSHQQAFAAASKIVQAVDEMMQTLLDLKR